MRESDSRLRALLLVNLLVALSLSEGRAEPAQTGNSSTTRVGTLSRTVSLPAQELSIRYPDDWSLVQATANSWVLLNVRADQLEKVELTVRVRIGYVPRSDHAEAV